MVSSAIFTSEVAALENQVAQLQARIAALGECESEADGMLQVVQKTLGKISALAPDAIATLKASVINLFDGNDGNQCGGQPVADGPAPEVSLPREEKSLDPLWQWENVKPEGQKVDIACQLEDCPAESLQGQTCELSCFWAPIKEIKLTHKDDVYEEWVATDSPDTTANFHPVADNKIGEDIEAKNLFKLVNLTNNVAYMRKEDGEILVSYAGFSSKAKAEQWGKWLTVHHSVGSAFEIRPAKRLTNCRYEVKLWGLSLKQIERLTECDLTKTPPSNFGDASKRKAEVIAFAPKSFQNDPEVVAAMETEAKLEEAAIEEAISSIQPPETPAPAYNPNPIGRRGAASNWKALQAAGGLQLKKHGTGINNGAAAVIEEKETSVLPESQAFKIGDSVSIKSARHGENLLGLTGTIKIANPVGCVVDVSGQTRWFCCDEIELLTDDFDVEF